ncbi:MAG: tRNA (adenosine(37)-N6)-threonylcarbamoyltransferase complex transferase subunit TsaD [Gammaproteobacteria bacterium]
MNILGIETSCDETGVAIYSDTGLLANILRTQTEVHQRFGGVVPELASRDHIQKILPLTQKALTAAKLSLKDIDGIAYTKGPGLIGALLVGAAFGRSLGFALNIPTIGIHHLEAHILASLLETPAPTFPFLSLLVSGGHTMLILAETFGSYQILGESVDDAAGEAFDKTARLLGLPYPGGAALAKLATQGVKHKYHLPRPMLNKPGLNFSFSGLKTQTMQLIRQEDTTNPQTKADIACAFEEAIIDTLVTKCKRAMIETNLTRLVIAGGVGANLELRQRLQHEVTLLNGELFFPRVEFCTDNAAMVAICGYKHLMNGASDNLSIDVKARWPLGVHKD